jgi:RimJ/RimL family protein N-acetyltransferase
MALGGESLKQYSASVVLRDGSVLRLRPIRPDDQEKMLALFYRLSMHTVYLRFHHVLKHMSEEEVGRFCTVDYDDSFALVGTVGEDDEEKIVAVGRYARIGTSDRAEVAFVVEDSYQGKGIATHLLQQLASAARKCGITVFEAEVLAENSEMMKVLRDSGYDIRADIESGVYRVSFSVLSTPKAGGNLI